jgi:dTDP-glucose 4,6-dehydratase
MLLKAYFDAYQFPVVMTRAANVYGPGQQPYRIIPRTMLFIKMQKKLQLHGGGLSVRSFIHMNDVADATWKIAQHGQSGETYHIATEDNISIKNLVELICHQMNVHFDDHVQIAEDRLGKDAAYLLDSTKLRDTLGWSDAIPLTVGVQESIRWVNDHFDRLKTMPLDYMHKE